jgi:hypothetical protein
MKDDSETNSPRLTREVWVNSILPMMPVESLLRFSLASKETRQIAFIELFKRTEFREKIQNIMNHEVLPIDLIQFGKEDFARIKKSIESSFGARALFYTRVASLVYSPIWFLCMVGLYVFGYPTPEEIQSELHSELTTIPIFAVMAAIPDDGFKTAIAILIGLISVGVIADQGLKKVEAQSEELFKEALITSLAKINTNTPQNNEHSLFYHPPQKTTFIDDALGRCVIL